MKNNEILVYFLIFLLTLLAATLPAVFNRSPDLSDPFNPDLPERTLPENTRQTQNNQPQEPRDPIDFGLFEDILTILVIVVLVGLIYLLLQYLKQTSFLKSSGKDRSQQAKIQRRELEDARKIAYQIIEEGLSSGKYTRSFIEAYIALDKGLENYREIMRPKHITPKEYAFSVSPPVFKPGVFRTVSTYYNLRYGSMEASKMDLINFKQQLDNLFIEDVEESVENIWTEEFEKAVSSDYNFKIPRYTDHTKPGGN